MGKNYSLSKEELYKLIERARKGDNDALEILVTENAGLIKSIALKYVRIGYELDDIIQVGYIGLLKAIERFEMERGLMFSTYAVPMVVGEIKRYIRDDGRIKIGRQIKQDVKKYRAYQEEFYNQNGYSPKISDLCNLLEMDQDQVLEIIEASEALYNMSSLDEADTMTSFTNIYTYDDEKNINMICLKGAIRDLPEIERQIIVLRYFKDYTQQQIADCIGLSQAQVSRIEKSVIKKIRRNVE